MDINIYKYRDYRKLIKDMATLQKKRNPQQNFLFFARAIQIQPSYFSKVINSKADFSTDQLFSFLDHFQFRPEEEEYIEKLHALQTSGSSRRKKSLRQQLEQIRLREQQTEKNLEVSRGISGIDEYFLSPIHALVHAALSIPEIQRQTPLLCQPLGISEEQLQKSIEFLLKKGAIKKVSGRLISNKESIHINPDSPSFPTWKERMNSLCQHRLSHNPQRSDWSFSASFSANSQIQEDIRWRFLELLKDMQQKCTLSKEQNLFQLKIDLFKWI